MKFPNTVLLTKLLKGRAALREDSDLETTHVIEQIRIVFTVNRNEGVLPIKSGQTARQMIFDLPKARTTQVNIVLDQHHPGIARPTLLIVVANDVLIVGVRVLTKEPLN